MILYYYVYTYNEVGLETETGYLAPCKRSKCDVK